MINIKPQFNPGVPFETCDKIRARPGKRLRFGDTLIDEHGHHRNIVKPEK